MKLTVVLDSNEYINYLNKNDLSLQKIFTNEDLSVYLNDFIIREVLRNLIEAQKKEFYNLIFQENVIFHGQKLPFYLFEKYKKLGLKKGDIEIAAFCEALKVDYLITKNRHFLKSTKLDMFEILSINDFLTKIFIKIK